MGQLRHVLKHSARRLRYVEAPADEWVEGEPGEDGPVPVASEPFPVVLFLPLGTETEGPVGRKITRPTLLWEPVNADTAAAVPQLGPDDELLILALDLAPYFPPAADEPAGTGRWQIEGRPQPFGPPGRVIGVQATLKQVEP